MPKFSLRELNNTNRDTKPIGKKRRVAIFIPEKTRELRAILYPDLQGSKKTLKKKTDEEIIEILQIHKKIKEKYPQTEGTEKELLIDGLMGRIKQLLP